MTWISHIAVGTATAKFFGFNYYLAAFGSILPDLAERLLPGKVAHRGLTLRFAMPLQQDGRWNFNVSPKFFGGVPAQEQAIEEGGLPLREVEVVLGIFGSLRSAGKRRVGISLHQRLKTEKAVYRKFLRRQVVPPYRESTFSILEHQFHVQGYSMRLRLRKIPCAVI